MKKFIKKHRNRVTDFIPVDYLLEKNVNGKDETNKQKKACVVKLLFKDNVLKLSLDLLNFMEKGVKILKQLH